MIYFLADSFFDQLIFYNLFMWKLIFLTSIFFDSLSNYLTYQLGVWDSRPLVLFFNKINSVIWHQKKIVAMSSLRGKIFKIF